MIASLVPATNIFAARREIIRALRARAAQPGNALSDVQVLYAYSARTADRICVYGAGATFEQPEEEEMSAGPGDTIPTEHAIIGLQIRISLDPPPPGAGDLAAEFGPVAVSDEMAENIAGEIAWLLRMQPHLAGGQSVSRIVSGVADYFPTDDETVSIVGLRIQVDSDVRGG
jgi:hypothetical protein